MYLCTCNPFTDKNLDEHLSAQKGSVKVADAYKACTGGESPKCSACIPEITKMVQDHNEEDLE